MDAHTSHDHRGAGARVVEPSRLRRGATHLVVVFPKE
jgi:hypothetical protein